MTTKNPVSVSKNFGSSRLSRLAILAGAATALPLAAHADAIVYSGPVDITGDANSTTSFPTPYALNVDGNVASAFTFTAEYEVAVKEYVYVTPGPGNGYVSSSSVSGSDPTALSLGQLIGSSSTFSTGGNGTLSETSVVVASDYPFPPDGTPAYLGVEFVDADPGVGNSADQTYYGWIEVGATSDDATYSITGYAYCNSGGSILAGQTSGACNMPATASPEPSSLALLALGAAGLAALRHRRKSKDA